MAERLILTQQELAPVLNDLPNFPVPLIDQWLGRAIRATGWPPPSDPVSFAETGWPTALRRYPIAFWRTVTWSLEKFRFSELKLNPEGKETLWLLTNAYGRGSGSPIAAGFAGGQRRFDQLAQEIASTGRLPVPPVFLARGDALEVIDGFRRLAAYVFCTQEGLAVEEHQERWVGRPAEAPPEHPLVA